jgi:hypothetical protein
LSVELRQQKFSEHAEHIASRIGGGLLLTLAIYVIIAALVASISLIQKRRRREFARQYNMPKPFGSEFRSGAHFNVSLADRFGLPFHRRPTGTMRRL